MTTNEYGYEFNDSKVCVNPKILFEREEKQWRARIKVARIGKDEWCYGYDADMKYGNFAGVGCPCGNWKRDNVPTEREAAERAVKGLLQFARQYDVKSMREALEKLTLPRQEYIQLSLFD